MGTELSQIPPQEIAGEKITSGTVAAARIATLPASQIGSGRLAIARLPDGALAYPLTGQGAGSDPAYAVASADWKVIVDQTLGSTVDYVDINSLSINNDLAWKLILLIGNANAGVVNVYLTVNGLNTATDYYNQLLSAGSTTLTGARANSPMIGKVGGNGSEVINATIARDRSGYLCVTSQNAYIKGASITLETYSMGKTATVADITSLRLAGSAANGYAASTRIILARYHLA